MVWHRVLPDPGGERRIPGARLICSSGVIESVVSRKAPVLRFTIENVLAHDKAMYS
jgi:hypothetical protein